MFTYNEMAEGHCRKIFHFNNFKNSNSAGMKYKKAKVFNYIYEVNRMLNINLNFCDQPTEL